MSNTYRVTCLSEAISPITHSSGTEGNESVLMRETVVTDNGVVGIPCLSGNAIRHRAVREPGVRWLIERYRLPGLLTREQLNWLFHGGNLTEGGGRENTGWLARIRECLPLVHLLGGALPSQIVSGCLHVGRGVLVCEENRSALMAVLPDCWPLPNERMRSAEHVVTGYQYTRGDAAKTHAELMTPSTEEVSSNLMIYSGQSVARGALFLHDFTLPNVERVSLGALLHSLALWQAQGGTIGGKTAIGHGRLRSFVCVNCDDPEATMTEYRERAESMMDDAVALLNEMFAPPKPKKVKVTA